MGLRAPIGPGTGGGGAVASLREGVGAAASRARPCLRGRRGLAPAGLGGGARPARRHCSGNRARMAAAAASPARELTQNPLQKTWEPYDNGLPAGHSAQRGGERGGGEGRTDGWRRGLPGPRCRSPGSCQRPLLLLLLLG